jgi:hypothetical protein
MELFAKQCKDVDILISTALIPGEHSFIRYLIHSFIHTLSACSPLFVSLLRLSLLSLTMNIIPLFLS